MSRVFLENIRTVFDAVLSPWEVRYLSRYKPCQSYQGLGQCEIGFREMEVGF